MSTWMGVVWDSRRRGWNGPKQYIVARRVAGSRASTSILAPSRLPVSILTAPSSRTAVHVTASTSPCHPSSVGTRHVKNRDAIETFVHGMRMPHGNLVSRQKQRGPVCSLLKHVKNTVTHAPTAAFPSHAINRHASPSSQALQKSPRHAVRSVGGGRGRPFSLSLPPRSRLSFRHGGWFSFGCDGEFRTPAWSGPGSSWPGRSGSRS